MRYKRNRLRGFCDSFTQLRISAGVEVYPLEYFAHEIQLYVLELTISVGF